jgi:hypothetical protein
MFKLSKLFVTNFSILKPLSIYFLKFIDILLFLKDQVSPSSGEYFKHSFISILIYFNLENWDNIKN